jgi:hypothetical protein
MIVIRARDGKCEHVCAYPVVTGDAQKSADLNSTNKCLGNFVRVRNVLKMNCPKEVKSTIFM